MSKTVFFSPFFTTTHSQFIILFLEKVSFYVAKTDLIYALHGTLHMIPGTGWTQDSECCVQGMPLPIAYLIKEESFLRCLARILCLHPRTITLEYLRLPKTLQFQQILPVFSTVPWRFNISFLWVSNAFHVCNINCIFIICLHGFIYLCNVNCIAIICFYSTYWFMAYLVDCETCQGRSNYINLLIFEIEQT